MNLTIISAATVFGVAIGVPSRERASSVMVQACHNRDVVLMMIERIISEMMMWYYTRGGTMRYPNFAKGERVVFNH